MPSGYARSRAKDEEARAALRPLRPGERPTAVTVGAIAATVLAVANLVALAFGYNAGEDTLSPGSKVTGSILATLVVGARRLRHVAGEATGACSGCRRCSR